MECPNCKREVAAKKYVIFNCECGSLLMEVLINKVKQIVDVTPNKKGEES